MANYGEGVHWIAHNDDVEEVRAPVIARQLTVALVADLWKQKPEKVAADVLEMRMRPAAQSKDV